ncbi:MAG: ribonuclease HII [Anaerolineae bacterium]
MPTIETENRILAETGLTLIAGLDEAGRGALAGPVVAAAVILPLDRQDRLETLREVDDSKRLSARTRNRLYDLVTTHALAYGVGATSAQVVDQIGIIPATKQAMQQALGQLTPPAEYLLIDGRIRLSNTPLPQQAIIRGDSKSLSIASASILAKVTRDQMMVEMDVQFPHYGFARHKGYGTPQHLATIAQHGPSPHHRLSFSPLRQALV